MADDYEFNDYFRLVQSFLALFFHALAVYLFVDTARRVFTSAYGEMSPLLKLLLLLWIVEGILSFPYSATIPLWWIDDTRALLTDEWFFWAVIFERSLSCALPAAVLFLTVDRCFTLLFGLSYERAYKMMICALCALVVAVSAGICLYLYLVSWIHEFYDVGLATTGCMSTVCVFESADDWQFLVRVTFGTLNFACPLCFYLVLRRYNRKAFAHASSGKSKSASNSFVIYAVASELLLNFVPHAGCLAYELTFQHNISDWFGTYSRLLTAIDAVTCAVMYRRVRKSMVAQAFAQTPTASIPKRKKSVNVVTPTIVSVKLLSYTWSHFVVYVKILIYFMSFQAVLHTIVAINRFSAFYLPTHHEKLWRGPILVGLILCSAAISSFPIVASFIDGFLSYRRYGIIMFLQGSEYDSSGTALIYIAFSSVGFALSILTLLRLRRHMASEYFDGSMKGQDVRLLVHSMVMIFLELLKAIYFVSDQVNTRRAFRSCSREKLTQHECDNLKSLQEAIERVTLVMTDVEFFVNVAYCSCGSVLLLGVSSYVRQTYLRFYGLSRLIETNSVTTLKTVTPAASR